MSNSGLLDTIHRRARDAGGGYRAGGPAEPVAWPDSDSNCSLPDALAVAMAIA